MDTFLFYCAVVTILFWIIFGIELVTGSRSVGFLKDVSSSKGSVIPKVSIIVPARNEEEHIQEALHSLLNQDHESVEIIAINDRSTDQTSTILTRMVKVDPRLLVVQITELPPGWLGKNYALYCGAQKATGNLLLFTDADVVMEPSTVSKAVNYMLRNQLDHLTISPEVRMPGVLLGMFTAAFAIFFSLYAMPWRAKNPRSGKHVGIGGFNMVRTEVYRAIGMHQSIAMRPDDDMKLGKLIKKHRYKQELLLGNQMMYVEWYSSLRELIEGLMKNTFAAVDYNIPATIVASIVQFVFNVWPFLALFVTSGLTQIINFVTVPIILLLCWDATRIHNVRRWYGIGFPVCTLLFIYIMWRSMLITIFHNGLDWRGTHYSLKELKANKV